MAKNTATALLNTTAVERALIEDETQLVDLKDVVVTKEDEDDQAELEALREEQMALEEEAARQEELKVPVALETALTKLAPFDMTPYEALPTKSAKIRAMHKDGVKTATIAKALNILYQHARNVINQPAPKRTTA